MARRSFTRLTYSALNAKVIFVFKCSVAVMANNGSGLGAALGVSFAFVHSH